MYGHWVTNGAGCERRGVSSRVAEAVLQAELQFSWNDAGSAEALSASWAYANRRQVITALAQQLAVNVTQITITRVEDILPEQRRLSPEAESFRLLAAAPIGFSVEYLVEISKADDQARVRDAASIGGTNFSDFVGKVEVALVQEGNPVPASLRKAIGKADAEVMQDFYLPQHTWIAVTGWSECGFNSSSAWRTRQIECSTDNPEACDLFGRLPETSPCEVIGEGQIEATGITIALVGIGLAVCLCVFRCCWSLPPPRTGNVLLKNDTGEEKDIKFTVLRPGDAHHAGDNPSSPRQPEKTYVVWNIDLDDISLRQDWQIDAVHVEGPSRNLRQIGDGIVGHAPELEVELPTIPYENDGEVDLEQPHGTSTLARYVHPTGTARPIGQVYKSGERVEYWSKTHQTWIPARVTRALYHRGNITDLCDVSVGYTSHQTIRQVELSLIRLPLQTGEAVSVYFADDDHWYDGEVAGATALPTRYGYRIRLLERPDKEDTIEEDEDAFAEASKLGRATSQRLTQIGAANPPRSTPPLPQEQAPELMPASRVRRRFSPGDQVGAYLGPTLGWAYAEVLAKNAGRFSIADADEQVPSPHASAADEELPPLVSPRGPGFARCEEFEVQLLAGGQSRAMVQLHCLLPSARCSFL